MEKELISVIVPVYNVEAYLDECVNSILEQTYKNLEIILIDDGSTDNSGKMCDEYAARDKRIRVIHKKNGGQAEAKNRGLDICTGDFITFVDSDDYVDKEYIDYMYNLLKKYNVDISYCKWRFVFFNGKLEKEEKHLNEYVETQKMFFENLLYCRRAVGQWSYLYKREIFDNLRYREGIIFEDSDLSYKLINKCDRIAGSNNQLYFYRLRQGSTTNSEFDTKKMKLIEVSEEMCNSILSVYPDLKKAAASKMVWAVYSTLNQLYKSKNIDRSLEKEILDTGKLYENTVLKDQNAPKMNKFGIMSRRLGRRFYMLLWGTYSNIIKKS